MAVARMFYNAICRNIAACPRFYANWCANYISQSQYAKDMEKGEFESWLNLFTKPKKELEIEFIKFLVDSANETNETYKIKPYKEGSYWELLGDSYSPVRNEKLKTLNDLNQIKALFNSLKQLHLLKTIFQQIIKLI